MTSVCEWNPKTNQPATLEDEFHDMAALVVGAFENWHLCTSCAALPRFKRFSKRRLTANDADNTTTDYGHRR
jgi:hypothetical protein